MTEPDEFVIEKNIDPPKRGGGRKSRYPFKRMAIGDSFFVPDHEDGLAIRAARAAALDHLGAGNYTTREMMRGGVKGVRIWRTG